MKKLKLLLVTVLFSAGAFAQTGIGTTNPTATLTLKAATNTDAFRIVQDNNEDYGYSFQDDSSDGSFKLNRWDNGSRGSNLMTVTSTGNVGIGSATPNSSKLYIYNDVDGQKGLYVNKTADALSNYPAGHFANGTGETLREVMLAGNSDYCASFLGGNVGIGTTTPADLLHVGNLIIGGDNDRVLYSTTDYDILYKATGNASHSFFTNGVERLKITDAGNVGIGTASPISKLSVVGGALTTQSGLSNTSSRPPVGSSRIAGEIAGVGATFASDDGFLRLSAGGGTNSVKTFIDLSGYSTVPDMVYNIVFGTAGTERMRITNTGYVGIGTTTPGAKLHIAGFGYGVANGIIMTPVNDTEGGAFISFVNTENTGIGSIARGAGNSVTYNTSSDYRLKENVKELDIQTTLEKIRHARPVSYTWKSDGSPDVGFIAHELEEAGFDYAVSGEKDALDEKGNILPQAVDYGRITPEILRAVQYLLNENDALQNKIELITAQNSELKSENSGIRAENVEIKKQMESLASNVEALKSVVYGTAQANYHNLKNE